MNCCPPGHIPADGIYGLTSGLESVRDHQRRVPRNTEHRRVRGPSAPTVKGGSDIVMASASPWPKTAEGVTAVCWFRAMSQCFVWVLFPQVVVGLVGSWGSRPVRVIPSGK